MRFYRVPRGEVLAMESDWRDVIEPLKKIFSNYWALSRWTIVLVVSTSFISSILSVAAPYVFARLVDRLTSGASFDVSAVDFSLYALLLGVAVALDDSVAYLSLMCARNLEFIVATSFFDRVLKKTTGFFVDHNPAEILNAQTSGEEALNDLFELALSVFIPGVTQMTLSLIVLGTMISFDIVVIVVIYGTAFIALTALANERTRRNLHDAMSASQENAKFVGNAVNAMETLRQFGSDRWMTRRFGEKAIEVRDSWLSFCLRRVGYTGIFAAMLAIEFAVTFVILLPRYKAGQLSVGDLVLFNAVLLHLNHPFEMIGRSGNQLVRTYSQLVPFARIWLAPEEPEPAAPRAFGLSRGRIEFENVGFAYEGGHGVEGVDFVAERGRITYLVGETGAGKSTVIKLALKSLEPETGRISVDGIDLNDVSRADWYSVIGVVPQEVMLVNDTLATNIVLGRQMDETRLRKAARKAAILDFIEALPDRFATTVGERGLKLSGGERQRIAIARALYAEPAILFLDEASSALDEATERDILEHIRAIANEVTVVAITHREKIIGADDTIVRMSDGHVVTTTDAAQPTVNSWMSET